MEWVPAVKVVPLGRRAGIMGLGEVVVEEEEIEGVFSWR